MELTAEQTALASSKLALEKAHAWMAANLRTCDSLLRDEYDETMPLIDSALCEIAALSSPSPVTLPGHEGIWFEWDSLNDRWHHDTRNVNFGHGPPMYFNGRHSILCRPGHWIHVALPPAEGVGL